MLACPHCGTRLPVQATLGWAHMLLERGVTFAAPGTVVQVYPTPRLPSVTVSCRYCHVSTLVSVEAPAAAA